jgi:hypothetical protein
MTAKATSVMKLPSEVGLANWGFIGCARCAHLVGWDESSSATTVRCAKNAVGLEDSSHPTLVAAASGIPRSGRPPPARRVS